MNAMRYFNRLAVLAALGLVTASCGDVARSGRAPVFLVIDRLEGSSGPTGTLSTTLLSDVLTSDSILNDPGQVTLHLSLKDIGSVDNPTSPSSNNQVTITRYRVNYRRADGRNTPGLDVPYGFDGAATGTVPASGSLKLGFELVRHVAKAEAPLVQLVNNRNIITTIADVTFYGQDLVGNEIQATGSIQIDFGNFADPKSSDSQTQ